MLLALGHGETGVESWEKGDNDLIAERFEGDEADVDVVSAGYGGAGTGWRGVPVCFRCAIERRDEGVSLQWKKDLDMCACQERKWLRKRIDSRLRHRAGPDPKRSPIFRQF